MKKLMSFVTAMMFALSTGLVMAADAPAKAPAAKVEAPKAKAPKKAKKVAKAKPAVKAPVTVKK